MSKLINTLHCVFELKECEKYNWVHDAPATCECARCSNGLATFFEDFLCNHDMISTPERESVRAAHYPTKRLVDKVAKHILRAFYQEVVHMRERPRDYRKLGTVFFFDEMSCIIVDGPHFCNRQRHVWAALMKEVNTRLAL